MISRCINIDWLEVYCHEDATEFPLNAEYFRNKLWHVVEREYGTRVYKEMFTLYGKDNCGFLEIRRNPKSVDDGKGHGILDPTSCHIKLCNRTCYYDDAVDCLRNFCARYHYTIIRIARIDICYDFTRFEYGDEPAKFVERYMKGKYSKVNQSRLSGHANDSWAKREWNSLSWGSKNSMVGTKMYDKTLELKEAHDKPYIRQRWKIDGLVDDEVELTKMVDGKPIKQKIWRVEFSIQSGTRNWFILDVDENGNRQIRSVRHTLAMYDTKQKLNDVFLSLAEHYFHFKKLEYDKEGEIRRKYDCEDKLLFNTKDIVQFHKLETTLLTDKPQTDKLQRLIDLLEQYYESHPYPNIYKATRVLIESMMIQQRTDQLIHPWPQDEIQLIRLLISKRIHNQNKPLSDDINTIKGLLQVEQDLFGEKN